MDEHECSTIADDATSVEGAAPIAGTFADMVAYALAATTLELSIHAMANELTSKEEVGI